MKGFSQSVIAWNQVDTVLVDMDGTLLDLAFDNFFWREVVPAQYAKKHGLSENIAREELMSRYEALQGKLEWYCIDHWTADLKLDIRRLKHEHRSRIQFLPGATNFLSHLRKRQKRVVLVTNAHPDVLALKIEQTGVDEHVDAVFSSHEFEAPKETREFWHRFHASQKFKLLRTALIDDSVSVLKAARDFGIGSTVGISRPDSRFSSREIEGFLAVEGVKELID
jgi:putative hydrolase of the HAD superfamily